MKNYNVYSGKWPQSESNPGRNSETNRGKAFREPLDLSVLEAESL